MEFHEWITPEEARAWIEEKMQNSVTHHFGHPYLNVATIAGLLRMLVKEWRSKSLVDASELQL